MFQTVFIIDNTRSRPRLMFPSPIFRSAVFSEGVTRALMMMRFWSRSILGRGISFTDNR